MPSADISKEVPGKVGDGQKTCPGCLGRDTIANAAARVGPAVVNLSVPQSNHGFLFSELRHFAETLSFEIFFFGG